MPDRDVAEFPDAEFVRGAELHAGGKYWDAHEVWEALWRASTTGERRLLLQGLIQVTAAFHKLYEMSDRASAIRLLTRGLDKLETLSASCDGVDVESFRERARACREALERGETVERAAVPHVALASLSR